MVKRYNRLLVAIHVAADFLAGGVAFALAYWLRFHSFLVEILPIKPGGAPILSEYLMVVPLVAALVPLTFQLQGLYRLRRSRTRVDDFFAVLVGSILTVLAGVTGALFIHAYYPTGPIKDPISRAVRPAAYRRASGRRS